MNASRREFLRTSIATGGLVSWGLTVPTFLTRTALAAPFADKKGAKAERSGVTVLWRWLPLREGTGQTKKPRRESQRGRRSRKRD